MQEKVTGTAVWPHSSEEGADSCTARWPGGLLCRGYLEGDASTKPVLHSHDRWESQRMDPQRSKYIFFICLITFMLLTGLILLFTMSHKKTMPHIEYQCKPKKKIVFGMQ